MDTNAPAAVGLQGYAPVFVAVSDFQDGEISLTSPRNGGISLLVPANTPNRKIYCWLWVNNSAANYYAKGWINFFKGTSPVGKLPVSIGGGTGLAQSLPSVCTANGSNIQDCIGVYLSNPTGTQPASLILQPLYISGIFDRMTFDLPDMVNVSAARVYMAVISSQ